MAPAVVMSSSAGPSYSNGKNSFGNFNGNNFGNDVSDDVIGDVITNCDEFVNYFDDFDNSHNCQDLFECNRIHFDEQLNWASNINSQNSNGNGGNVNNANANGGGNNSNHGNNSVCNGGYCYENDGCGNAFQVYNVYHLGSLNC